MSDDDLRAALDASTTLIAELDQQLAAAREANARLTAALVAAEIRERLTTDRLIALSARADELEAALTRRGDR